MWLCSQVDPTSRPDCSNSTCMDSNAGTRSSRTESGSGITQAAHGGSGAEVNGNRLADKAVVGTDWWIVRAALKRDVLAESDIKATGFTLQQLERTIVTHDYKEN